MFDVIIIGAGPAGISSALYAKRANLNVLVLYYGQSNLEKTIKIDNYYGFTDGIDGEKLYKNGIKQAQNLGIELKEEEVINIEKSENHFNILTTTEEYTAKTVIIATGNKKLRPNIKGIEEFEGKGISYCAICDGFFYRNKDIVVIGEGDYAFSEANSLKGIVNRIKILTNGKEIKENRDYEVISKKIKEIHGDNTAEQIEFEDGSKIDIDGIFIAIGEAGGVDFARKIGVMLNDDSIIVDKNMQTNVEGLYACGNVTGGLLQICKAVHEGAVAGLSTIDYIKKIKKEGE